MTRECTVIGSQNLKVTLLINRHASSTNPITYIIIIIIIMIIIIIIMIIIILQVICQESVWWLIWSLISMELLGTVYSQPVI